MAYKQEKFEVILIAQNKQQRQPIQREFFWYDSVTKKMASIQGGRMELRYFPKEHRIKPVAVDDYAMVTLNNWPDLLSIADDYRDHIQGMSDHRSITLHISEDDWYFLRPRLETNQIRYIAESIP